MQPLTEPLAAATFTERARRGAQEAVFFFFSVCPRLRIAGRRTENGTTHVVR